MNHLRVISNPVHPSQSRPIQPMDFSEKWSLCYDLASVVEYAVRAAHADSIVNVFQDLKMAEWHLLKKIIEEQGRLSKNPFFDPLIYNSPLVQNMRTSPFPMMAEAIAREWGLPLDLKEVIFYITTFQNLYYRFPYMRAVLLKQAFKHLKREIDAAHEQLTHPTTA